MVVRKTMLMFACRGAVSRCLLLALLPPSQLADAAITSSASHQSHLLFVQYSLYRLQNTISPRAMVPPLTLQRFRPPIPVQRPWLNRRRSFPLNAAPPWPTWGGQNTALAVGNDHLLCRYLPLLAKATYEWNTNVQGAALRFVQDSDDVVENDPQNALTMSDLQIVYQELLEAIERYKCRGNGAENLVSQHFLAMLNDYLDRGERRRYLLLFVALAAISAQTQSYQLGVVLGTFFLDTVHDLLDRGDINTVALWACGIYRAVMPEEDLDVCFREIGRHAPELVRILERHGTRLAASVTRALQEVGFDDDRFGGALDIGSRGRRRRDEWDEDLFAPTLRPRRRFDGRDRLTLEPAERILRPRSAPGEKRRIVRQTERLLEAADDMQLEADKLRRVVLDRN